MRDPAAIDAPLHSRGAAEQAPRISVILPVYNGKADLRHAIASILDQSFADFELIAIDDGSTDGSAAILDAVDDPRVRVIHQANVGLAATLNRGIVLARGEYIARQDHDDLSLPVRLARELQFLEENPGYGLVGTRAEIKVGDEPANRFHDHPTTNAALQFELLFDNPFVHSSVMVRKSILESVGGYSTDPARQPPEDYELWSRISRHCQIANLPERLTIYRETASGMSRTPGRAFRERVVLISSENLARAAGHTAASRVHRDIAALFHNAFDLASRNPDFERMREVIEEAGARIHATDRTSDVPARLGGRIEILRGKCVTHRIWRVLGRAWPLAYYVWRYSGLAALARRRRAGWSRRSTGV